ncbi:hypothetical protein D6C86_07613 [Aureobasidium pullulans]|uniref:GP-PDE domain-containing protein n=1 Tax=Aureobasidium pullulans TaxID=5580 RepID=A0A4S9DF00_AURPU|nr:hypothetical protein D6D17_02228 [Aureobasidium pullulans]THX24107.1 hypothetical protein D6D12_07914 [Aureobasidium pullulans]THX65774.1 hypothetical protein D6D11_00218 [Aureobasidium pullulans]THY70917.1 hypothetical protein D6C94_08186 [Aureobasidium pullulans]THZ38548.1 hypothetical protein D6C87_07745 [Aureobasidium pullulans]
MHCSPLATLLTLVILVEPLFAYQTIAHRGLFHDVNDHNAVAENSIDAMYRAEALGLPGVEFDLRLSSDNQVLVIHDIVSNRATFNDNYGGRLDAVDVSLNLQPEVAPISVNSKPASSWIGTGLKGRKTMSILPNPDAGRIINTQCTLWTYQSGSVKAARFDESARKAKLAFVEIAKPDYVVLDLMGDLGNRRWIGDFSSYIIYLVSSSEQCELW